MLRYPFIWPPFAASCPNLGSSCCEEEEEEEERRLLGNICRSLITCRTGRREGARGPRRPRERIFLARARGCARLGDRA